MTPQKNIGLRSSTKFSQQIECSNTNNRNIILGTLNIHCANPELLNFSTLNNLENIIFIGYIIDFENYDRVRNFFKKYKSSINPC
jgi:hypothetical protein